MRPSWPRSVARQTRRSRSQSFCVARLLPGACFSRARFLLRSRAIRKKTAQGRFGRQCSAADSLSTAVHTRLAPLHGHSYDYCLALSSQKPCDQKNSCSRLFGRLCSAADSLSIMRRTTSPRDFVLSQDLPRPCPGATQADLLLLLSWACGLQLAMAPSAPAVVLRSLPAR
jgi:hypothetical protein